MTGPLLTGAVLVACVVSIVLAGLRWLRVAQREHYIAGRVRRIAGLWFSRSRLDLVLAAVAGLLALAASVRDLMVLALPAALLVALVPRGLGVKGRTSPLSWTSRLRRLVAVWVVLQAVLGVALVALLGAGALALVAVAVPLVMDAALAVTEVVERRLSAPFVAQAQRRLARVRPQVVAITGSYGKTSTKGYIAHVLSAATAVVASPASFNNRLGLSRAVNDGLVDGTEVFVAEMGTYGPGEIRELCRLFPPDVAVITTIGEAHLERMRTTATVLAAKSEITERAATVVLPVDSPELAGLAERCRTQGKRVISVSVREALTVQGEPLSDAGQAAAGQEPDDQEPDVVVDLQAGRATVREADGRVVTLPVGQGVAHGVNLAVALGVALAVGADVAALGPRLSTLPRAAHRAEVQDTGTGLLVVDDTYNANPIGARAALGEAAALAAGREGRLVVVTPGIVELGPVQHRRNADFAEAAARAGAHLVVVGRTNRAALLEGARRGGGEVDVVDRRPEAVPLATARAGAQGVILYENDLPDHYP